MNHLTKIIIFRDSDMSHVYFHPYAGGDVRWICGSVGCCCGIPFCGCTVVGEGVCRNGECCTAGRMQGHIALSTGQVSGHLLADAEKFCEYCEYVGCETVLILAVAGPLIL